LRWRVSYFTDLIVRKYLADENVTLGICGNQRELFLRHEITITNGANPLELVSNNPLRIVINGKSRSSSAFKMATKRLPAAALTVAFTEALGAALNVLVG
jgi:hypothetical protein